MAESTCVGPGVDGPCGRPLEVKSLQLCSAHYSQHHRGGPLRVTKRAVSERGCTFDSCDHPVKARGLCAAHYFQRREGKPLQPVPSTRRRRRGDALIRDDEGRKLCVACSTWKHCSEFASSAPTMDGLNPRCRSCWRWSVLLRKYGLSEAAYAKLLADQEGRCAICAREPESLGAPLSVDHDHQCCPGKKTCGSCVRGLLCLTCNAAIGYLGDSAELARRATGYLTK